jgi:hypothetical protein
MPSIGINATTLTKKTFGEAFCSVDLEANTMESFRNHVTVDGFDNDVISIYVDEANRV